MASSSSLLPSSSTIAATSSSSTAPNQKNSYVHGACILANSIFGLGSIVGALGLSATNPLTFTFIREICAGTLLYLLSILTTTTSSGYIVGIGLAGPVTGSVWQPSAPIFTVAFSMLLGLESWNLQRFTGVLIAFVGCTVMVLLSDHHSQDEEEENDDDDVDDDASSESTARMMTATSVLMGNIMFLINCSATAGYILSSKKLLRRYPALTVTAWSYILASVFMLVAAFVSSKVSSVEGLICPTCRSLDGGDTGTGGTSSAFAFLSIPRATLPALAYYIVFQSVTSWGLILWSNQYATGTLVVGYSVLQPVTSILFTTLFLVTHWVASCGEKIAEGDPTTPPPAATATASCLNEPGIGTVCGMLGVACGLAFVVQTEPSSPPTPHQRHHHHSNRHRHGHNREHELNQEHDETLLLVSLTEYGSVPLLPKHDNDNDNNISGTSILHLAGAAGGDERQRSRQGKDICSANYGTAAAADDSHPTPCNE